MDAWTITMLGLAAVASMLAIVVLLWTLFSRFLITAPPNQALVVFGRASSHREERDALGRSTRVGAARYVVGGAALVFPWTSSYSTLSLATLDVDVPVRATLLSADAPYRVDLRLGVQVKISSDPESLRAAAESLLGKSEAEIRALVRSVIESHVHTVLARISPYLLESGRDRVAAEVQVLASTDLVSMGLVVQSLGLKEIIPLPAGVEPLSSPPTAERAASSGEVALRLRKLEKRIEELDRRARTPEILPLAPSAGRAADLR